MDIRVLVPIFRACGILGVQENGNARDPAFQLQKNYSFSSTMMFRQVNSFSMQAGLYWMVGRLTNDAGIVTLVN